MLLVHETGQLGESKSIAHHLAQKILDRFLVIDVRLLVQQSDKELPRVGVAKRVDLELPRFVAGPNVFIVARDEDGAPIRWPVLLQVR